MLLKLDLNDLFQLILIDDYIVVKLDSNYDF